MKFSRQSVRRVLTAVTCGAAFLVMASVFVPFDTGAEIPPGELVDPIPSYSTDPHAGLPMLGTIEHPRYRAAIYATDLGPRYTVYLRETEEALGVLLAPHRVEEWFPDLPLGEMQFDRPYQMMRVDPAREMGTADW